MEDKNEVVAGDVGFWEVSLNQVLRECLTEE